MKKISLALVFIILIGCGPALFKTKWTREKAPEKFNARFETSKGNFEVEVERPLSPQAADRFYQLVKRAYFDNCLFYRVVPDFVAQFGNNDSLTYVNWNRIEVPDEPVIKGNDKGTLSFARGGPNSRGTDLFINLKDNNRLDTLQYNEVIGFPSFGMVTKGMEVVEKLYSGYDDSTMDTLSLMYTNEIEFLKLFPRLDSIHRAYIIK